MRIGFNGFERGDLLRWRRSIKPVAATMTVISYLQRCRCAVKTEAPRNEREIGLLKYLTEKFGRVSYERIVSGPGLVNVFSYLADLEKALAASPA